MSHHDDSTAHQLPSKPNGELLLAQALEACIRAERAQPGSSAEIVARGPHAARAELRRLLALAHSVEASGAGVAPSAVFVEAARSRLLHRITGEPVALTAPWLRPVTGARRGRRARWKWLVRGSVGLFAALLATTAALTASANSLPGDALYGVKQAQEELNLRLAADDQARVLALLRRADARLDETAQLLQQGRTSEAVQLAQRYDQSVERATTAFVITVDHAEPSRYQHLETTLVEQQERLENIILSAPEPARPDLREALTTTERGRKLMADPRTVERALGLRQSRPVAAAPVPTSHAEEQPTSIPTPRPTTSPPTLAPATATLVVVVARANNDRDEDAQPEREDDRSVVAVSRSNNGNGNGNSNRGNARSQAPSSQGSERSGGDEDRDSDEHQESTQVAALPAPVVEQHSSGQDEDRDDDTRDERLVVARPATQGSAPAVEARSGSGRSESSSNGGSSADRLAPPPQPANAPASTLQGSEDNRSSGSVSGSSGRSGPSATPTPTVKRGGDASKPASGDRSDKGGDSKSGSDD